MLTPSSLTMHSYSDNVHTFEYLKYYGLHVSAVWPLNGTPRHAQGLGHWAVLGVPPQTILRKCYMYAVFAAQTSIMLHVCNNSMAAYNSVTL